MTNSELQIYLQKLYKTYGETGGGGRDENLKNKTKFEAQFLLLAEKIQACRKEILKREDEKITQAARANINHRVRQMFLIIQNDRKRIGKIGKNKQQELRDLDVHLKELESLDKKRFRRKYDSSNSSSSSPGMILEVQGEDDMTLLPPIDISVSKKKILEYREQLDAGIEQFSEKLGALKDIALETRDEVDAQNKQLQNISNGVETQKGKLLKFNEELKSITNQVNLSTKLLFLFILAVILMILALILLVYLIVTIGFGF
eukprot:gene3677-6491_t